jgi:hypothetical protein
MPIRCRRADGRFTKCRGGRVGGLDFTLGGPSSGDHYAYEVVAGTRGHPQGRIGTFRTKAAAQASSRGRGYACYIKRIKVDAAWWASLPR